MPTEELFGAYHFLLEVAGERIGSFTVAEPNTQPAKRVSKIDSFTIKQTVVKTGKIDSFTIKQGIVKDELGRQTLDQSRWDSKLQQSGLLLKGFKEYPQSSFFARTNGGLQRGSGAGQLTRIVLFHGSKPVATWNFSNAWPAKVTGPSAGVNSQSAVMLSLKN